MAVDKRVETKQTTSTSENKNKFVRANECWEHDALRIHCDGVRDSAAYEWIDVLPESVQSIHQH